MYKRYIIENILTALSDTPAILIQGARQCGKTTLVREIVKNYLPQAQYFSLDDLATLAIAKHDQTGFIQNISGTIVIDEIQRCPELILSIKKNIDEYRVPGKFILTGSTNILGLKNLSDSLAGRMEIFTLWPLSLGEKISCNNGFIEQLFSNEAPKLATTQTFSESTLLEGGFPEVITRHSSMRKQAWFSSYMTSILQKDIRDLSQIEGLAEMPQLLAILASRIGNLINFSDIARTIKIPLTTLKRYFTLLEMTFLLKLFYPWHSNIRQRMVKAPKLFFCDTGLLSYLLGFSDKSNRHFLGSVLENFVAMELVKLSSWNQNKPHLYHYRTQNQEEVDFVLENHLGEIVAIEVKSTMSPKVGDFKTLKKLENEYSSIFKKGILFYLGEQLLPVSSKIWVVPISALF